MNRKTLTPYIPLLWILVIPVLNIFYGILNQGGDNVSNLATPLDTIIPFAPAFIIPYLMWYPFIFGMLIVIFFRNRSSYYRVLLTLNLGLIVCYVIYYYFQTTVTRPPITDQGLLHSLVNLVYQTDGPYNCFPSIHVLTSYLIVKGTANAPNLSKAARWFIVLISWSIIVSTVFVKQHVWLDAAGAIVLTEILYFACGLWFRSQVDHRSRIRGSGL
ncbi:phosphatase PAP2 family protein [Paenibacillus eucommiae]|uniref:Membrane-associated phospholipid phosphatase n=1 Tax=Paenibacillus eucommiae TaxID=1355755 RepID=A0ABS4J909_9BACL|nr:phosphatase PAP2 family protein [Paenibacillus eucommiae]MBP1996343.1 membrane-associated phospholipid phosphatase [Paenibacillus eucommiae]